MAFRYDVNKVYDKFLEEGGKTSFPDSLKQVLTWAKNDSRIYKREHLAYLLATAKAESGYSLQRWEADYMCGNVGMPYKDKPCQKALDYYRSSSSKKANYYDLGVDKNGLPYFGRGLIQLTGKGNYETYGKLIGKDLVGNADLALVPRNSYDIAVLYMNRRKTFDAVDSGDFTEARRTVNGGTNGLNEVNDAYRFWLRILDQSNVQEKTTLRKVERYNKGLFYGGLAIFLVGGGFISYYLYKKYSR